MRKKNKTEKNEVFLTFITIVINNITHAVDEI